MDYNGSDSKEVYSKRIYSVKDFMYQQLINLTMHQKVEEQNGHYFHLTEKHLQILWSEQKLLKKLATVEGKCIEVLSPGIWNQGAGPDFLKAHLRIGSYDYRGDIEIHLQDQGWYDHGHHCDKRYNDVILHLSYYSNPKISINKENGQQVFYCYLDESLGVSLSTLVDSIDFDLYPQKNSEEKGRCAELVFHHLSSSEIKILLQSAAYWRLERKLKYLETYTPQQRSWQFVGGIAMAMGYKYNAIAFIELFFYLKAYRDLPYEELLAMALGCCGFLEEKRKLDWESSSYYQLLRTLWKGSCSQIIYQAQLKLNQIRPLHHPIRRLAYLMHLLRDSRLELLWSTVLSIWHHFIDQKKWDFKQLKDDFLQCLPIYIDPYWDFHFTFEQNPQTQCLPSLGKDIKMHILLNTYLPLLYATIRESNTQEKEWEIFQEFYASLKNSETSRSCYLKHRFFKDEKGEKILQTAQMVQGAYQLHHDFCLHFEVSCKGCPFVERYYSQANAFRLLNTDSY